jgi:hypothetical protein
MKKDPKMNPQMPKGFVDPSRRFNCGRNLIECSVYESYVANPTEPIIYKVEPIMLIKMFTAR